MKKVIAIMLIVVFAFAGAAVAKGPGHSDHADKARNADRRTDPGKFWEREMVAQALSLNEREKVQLATLHADHRGRVMELREELKARQEKLRETLESEEFSPTEARKQYKSTEELRLKIQEDRFELQIAQRELLGPERFIKLRRMERHAMENRRGIQQ